MKKLGLIFFLVNFLILGLKTVQSQAFYGKGDVILQIGANFQNNGTGIMGTLDFGLADNISIGIGSGYLIGVEPIKDEGETKTLPAFEDRFDLRGRLNANIGNLLNIDDRLDIYPGLYVSMKNFGGHVGVRYFLSYGFGFFSEVDFPIAKYNTQTLTPAEKLHNQTTFNIGVAFGI
ncbi:MAG TPA: DUF6646 family protein [Flavobacteriaceae bacterium]|nr:DUF6646 family protein [Flavobacteriaceae bacterium]